jgi:hypothetical protein
VGAQVHPQELANVGFATYILDSYGPRNLSKGKACETFPTGPIASSPGTLRDISNGWPMVIASLKSILETGHALPADLPSSAAKEKANA